MKTPWLPATATSGGWTATEGGDDGVQDGRHESAERRAGKGVADREQDGADELPNVDLSRVPVTHTRGGRNAGARRGRIEVLNQCEHGEDKGKGGEERRH